MIHHYTTLQNLALILQSKKFRFNRIDKVDDLSESANLTYNLKSYYFVSCWTRKSEENIALWHMYKSLKGVRITMTENPFKLYHLKQEDFPAGFIKKDFFCPFNKEEFFIKNVGNNYVFIYAHFDPNFRLYDVKYFDEPDIMLKNSVTKEYNESKQLKYTINNNFPALVKSKEWEFQNESRFIIPILPCGKFDENSKKLIFEDDIIERIPFEMESYDAMLKDDSINNIEITLGPCCTEADEIIIKSLLEKFTSNGQLRRSKLTGTIACK